MKWVINRQDVLDWQSSALDPFVNTLRRHCLPDFGIDFMGEGIRENNGLTFLHRSTEDMDIYFISNIQDRPVNMPVTFRVRNKIPRQWDPYTGKISPLYRYEQTANGTIIPLNLASYASTFIVFNEDAARDHVVKSDLVQITDIMPDKITALAKNNGLYTVVLKRNKDKFSGTIKIEDITVPYIVSGNWRLEVAEKNRTLLDTTLTQLVSWTEIPRIRHFSGTGFYELSFDLPEKYLGQDFLLFLDPGKIGNIAEIEVNGKAAGITWMREQTLDVTTLLRHESNHLKIYVTNTLINKISALQQAPPVPEPLRAYYGSGMTDYVSGRQRTPEMGFSPLPPSGLLGPVKIIVIKKVEIPLPSMENK